MAMRRSARPIVARYVHTGGFNQLAGKSLLPGSIRPDSFYWKWRFFFLALALTVLSAGTFSLFFS